MLVLPPPPQALQGTNGWNIETVPDAGSPGGDHVLSGVLMDG